MCSRKRALSSVVGSCVDHGSLLTGKRYRRRSRTTLSHQQSFQALVSIAGTASATCGSRANASQSASITSSAQPRRPSPRMATPRMKRSTRASWAIGSKIVVASSTRPSSPRAWAAAQRLWHLSAGRGPGPTAERLRRFDRVDQGLQWRHAEPRGLLAGLEPGSVATGRPHWSSRADRGLGRQPGEHRRSFVDRGKISRPLTVAYRPGQARRGPAAKKRVSSSACATQANASSSGAASSGRPSRPMTWAAMQRSQSFTCGLLARASNSDTASSTWPSRPRASVAAQRLSSFIFGCGACSNDTASSARPS